MKLNCPPKHGKGASSRSNRPRAKKGTGRVRRRSAAKDAVADAKFEVLVNGALCEPVPDLDNPAQFPGAARAVQFNCPLDAIKDGYNTATISKPTKGHQQIVWAELRIEP